MQLHRHDLLEISKQGRQWALDHLGSTTCFQVNRTEAARLIAPEFRAVKAPGIVRREEGEGLPGAIPVGFSSPFRIDGRRFRLPAFVKADEILKITTPYQVLESDIPDRIECLKALREIKNEALKADVSLGVYGSAALEIYTGLPYTHDDSDLDLVIKAVDQQRLTAFTERAQAIGRRFNCRLDIELDLPSGHGVKMAEVLSGSDLVLGKSVGGVDLLQRSDVLAMCEREVARC
jgi:phosphoribosyl-dephospho-CoA transferase